MALLRPVVVNEPVSNGPGGIGQKGSLGLFIAQDGFIEGQHGNAQLVFVAVLQSSMGKFYRLAADKADILPDQGIRRFRICFRRVDLAHDAVLRPHHTDPSIPSSRRIRSRCWIFGVTA